MHRKVDEARIIVDDTERSDKDQVTFDLRNGYAALLMKTLFPARFRYRKIGGREPAETPHGDLFYQGRSARHFHRHVKDFWIRDFSEGVIPNHKSFNWPPQRANESAEEAYVPVYGPGYGRRRLEVEPEVPATTDYFLNVLKPSLNPDEKLPPIAKVETASTFGAAMTKDGRKYVVTFSKDSLEPQRLEITGR